MTVRRPVLLGLIPGCVVLASSLAISQSACAHGSFEQPISRVYGCFLEGPENPMSAACQAMVDIGGTQPLYDWNEVSQQFANGNHEALIPDGTLCGGGRDKYRGLNEARDDWIDTPLDDESQAGGQDTIDFVYYATAPHASQYFRFYVTKDGYDPLQALRWGDLDPVFCEITDPILDADDRYRMSCPMPEGKSGKHIIYNIWQRRDSQEAFYACIDVQFGETIDEGAIFNDSFE